jgi:anti-sigma-K factor RskA
VRCEHEISVGAYVLDALEPDEQLLMQQHVQECPVCSAAVRELEGLPRLLAGVPTPGEMPVSPAPSEFAFERFRRSATATATAVAAPPRRGGRWRFAVASAAAALVIGGAVATGVAVTSTVAAPETVEAVHDGVHVVATYLPATKGTDVTLALDGVPMGTQCELVAVGRDGREEATGPWTVNYNGTFHWTGWVSMEDEDIASWEVRATDGTTLVSVPA